MEENIVDIYTDKLLQSTNPGSILNQIYISLFDLEYSTKNIPMLNKLSKTYGRNRVFYALLEMSEMDKVDHTNISRLLLYFIKREFNKTLVETNVIDTKSIKKEISKKKKLKTRELFSDENI